MWLHKAKRRWSESSATGIGRQMSCHSSGWWSRASKIVDNCSCLTIFNRTAMNYHSMTVRSNSLSRGAEANVSQSQEKAHQKGEPTWAARYRDEQWADSSALCQNPLENHETPPRRASNFISWLHLFTYPSHSFIMITCQKLLFFCFVHLPHQKHIRHNCLVFKQSPSWDGLAQWFKMSIINPNTLKGWGLLLFLLIIDTTSSQLISSSSISEPVKTDTCSWIAKWQVRAVEILDCKQESIIVGKIREWLYVQASLGDSSTNKSFWEHSFAH